MAKEHAAADRQAPAVAVKTAPAGPANDLLALQGAAGNAAVTGLLHRSEQVAPPTVITGSGSGASSLRGFTRALMQSQRQNTARGGGAFDPVAAAEDIAHTNLGDIGQSITAPQMLPARSPDLRNPDDPPAVRTSLTFAAAHYRHVPLLDVADYTRERGGRREHHTTQRNQVGGLNRALAAGYGPGQVVHDPTGGAIAPRIRAELTALAVRIPAGQHGELLLYFAGHGGPDGFFGVDGRPFSIDALEAISTEAAQQRIQLVIMGDICSGGRLALLAQRRSQAYLQQHGASAAALGTTERLLAAQAALIEPLDRLHYVFEHRAQLHGRILPRLGNLVGQVRDGLAAARVLSTAGWPGVPPELRDRLTTELAVAVERIEDAYPGLVARRLVLAGMSVDYLIRSVAAFSDTLNETISTLQEQARPH